MRRAQTRLAAHHEILGALLGLQPVERRALLAEVLLEVESLAQWRRGSPVPMALARRACHRQTPIQAPRAPKRGGGRKAHRGHAANAAALVDKVLYDAQGALVAGAVVDAVKALAPDVVVPRIYSALAKGAQRRYFATSGKRPDISYAIEPAHPRWQRNGISAADLATRKEPFRP